MSAFAFGQVKAKPDHGKKEEAANEPPKPEREENKQQDQQEEGVCFRLSE